MQKFLYGIKLFLIVLLSFLFLASIEIAPYHPVLFIVAVLIDTVCIRFLWKSLQKSEDRSSQSTQRTCVSIKAANSKHAA